MQDTNPALPLDIREVAPEGTHGDLSLVRAQDRALLAALFQSVPGRAVLVDTAFIYRFANQEFLDFVGRTEEDVLGRHVADVLGAEVFDSYRPIEARLLAGEAIRWEGWADYGPVGRRYVQESVTPYRPDPAGPVCGVLAIARDLTDLKLRDEELAKRIAAHDAAEARHTAIVTSALDAIIVIDAEGIVVDFNPAAESIFGYSRAEAVGRPVADLIVPEEYRAAHAAGIRNYLETGVARALGRRLEQPAILADGTRIPIELAITDVTYNGKRAFAAHLRDLRPAKQAEAEIRQQRNTLHQKEKLAALGSLLAGVAHELNNPLSIITGQTMMLRDEAELLEDTRLADRCGRISAAADRCTRIVRSFLAMARQRETERRPASLATIIAESVELLEYNLRAAGVDIETNVAQDIPMLMLDAGQIHQVVLNLLVNARQALEEVEGPRRIRISARLDRSESEVALFVADSGPGVPSGIRSRIFDPFFTTKPQGVGTGIGLAVSRGLVEAHGGTLELVQEGEGGATFVMHLPLEPAAPEPAPDPAAPGTKARSGLRRRVLIVDDEPEIAALVAEIVTTLDFEPIIALGGNAAKDWLQRDTAGVAAILSDIRMPDGDGPGLYDWLVENRPALARRIGFVTGDALGPRAGRFLAESGCPLLEKPFAPRDIRDFLTDILR